MNVRKAVFPVAGLGTRFLPATKAMAKEMLPIVDKPLIQYAVEEAYASGITEIIFVTGAGKNAIENHFHHTCELEHTLMARDPLVNSITKVRGLVEKPSPDKAPSNLAIIGRYILTPEIFTILAGKEVGAGGEIQITDAMARLLDTQAIYGYRFEGTRFDCGNKAGFQMANLAFSMERPDMRERLLPFIQELMKAFS